MRSKFAIAGHPIHPALVALPIGLFVWALVCDVVYLATDRDKLWYDMAFWAGIGGILSALVAALPGIGDFLTVAAKTDAREIGLAHMGLNLTVIALFFVAMLLMLDEGATGGGRLGVVIVLHALGTGLLGLSGWLGGEMIFRSHVAVIPDTGEQERSEQATHRMRPAPGARR